MGYDVDRLITQAEESTRILGDIILKALREGGTTGDVNHRVKESAARRFDMDLTEMDLALTVGGYEVYYRKKALV